MAPKIPAIGYDVAIDYDVVTFIRSRLSLFNIVNRRATLYLGIFAFAMVSIGQWYFWRDTTDDAYILFRYVDRFVHGLGLTFNNGERVEGYSSPLWTLLLVSFSWAGLLPQIAHVLGAFFLTLSVWLIYRISNLFSFDLFQLMLVGAIVLLTPGVYYYPGAGLEGGLLQVLLLLAVFFSLGEKYLAAAAVMGLVGVTRPEGILYVVVWVVWLWRIRKVGIPWLAALAMLPLLSWEIFRISYYGAWLPNTAVAKAWMGIRSLGLPYLARFVVPIVSGSAAMLLLCIRRNRAIKPPAITLSLGFIGAAAFFVLYAQGDWMLFGRFVVPIVPLIAISFAVWFGSQEETASWKKIAIIFIVAISQIACWYGPMRRYAHDEGYATIMKGRDQLAIGEWISGNYPAGTTLATGRLGGISFGARTLTIWDMGGLTDREEALHHAKSDTSFDPVLARGPQLLAENDDPSPWNYRQNKQYFEWITSHYRFVRSFPQGNLGRMDLWEKLR